MGVIDLIACAATFPGATAKPTKGPTHGTQLCVNSGAEAASSLDVVLTSIDAEEPGLESVFDGDRPLAVRTRRATIDRLVADGSLVGASHLPAPGLGRFVRAEGRQYWQGL